MIAAHCAACGADVELELLKPIPDPVLCPSCKPTAPGTEGEGPELELLEAGNDGGVVGVDFKFK